jgi:hypothetical protein
VQQQLFLLIRTQRLSWLIIPDHYWIIRAQNLARSVNRENFYVDVCVRDYLIEVTRDAEQPNVISRDHYREKPSGEISNARAAHSSKNIYGTSKLRIF